MGRQVNVTALTIIYYLLGAASLVIVAAWCAHYASYRFIKNRALRERKWDYNICCGTTDGGGINADIMKHGEVPRFELITDVSRLGHPDGAFQHVLCSHTLEHVPDPEAMFRELRRIGRNVTILVPPLWDFTAALQPLEHQVIFLTLKSRHENHLPPFVRYWPARWLQAALGQRIVADSLADYSSTRFRQIADYLVPVVFSASAVMCLARHPFGLGGFGAACLVLWASKALRS
jgi:hypothetical protein